jgi:uncharacterized membrane protein YdfJ with MMPL/SSD domain
VRSLLMPSIATLLGRWFWWPQVVYPRGDYQFPETVDAGWGPALVRDENGVGQPGGRRYGLVSRARPET